MGEAAGEAGWVGAALYDGDDRIAVLGPNGSGPGPVAPVRESYLFDGVDHPLRMKRGSAFVYYELDLAGNVRQLRGADGTDLGGYRYTAFGKTVADDTVVVQPLRWKARWWQQLGATEIYDVRARQWSPDLGSFLSVDEYAFHDASSTLWGWPNQNTGAFSDPWGRDGTTSNPVQDLVDSGWLPPGLTIIAKGTRMRASGIGMMANDATFEAGMAKMNCGNAIIAAGAGVLATDAQVISGVADAAIGAANLLRGGGSYRAVRSANTGGEVHHMPAWGALKKMGDKNPFSHGGAPGILMEKGDHMLHMLTASWGRGAEAQAWRAETAQMLMSPITA